MSLSVEFCGDYYRPEPGIPFTIGRDADLVLDDDNLYLHRRFLQVDLEAGMWWVSNIGERLTATLSDADGRVEAWLAPSARLPLVFSAAVLRFSAGPTLYELGLLVDQPTFSPGLGGARDDDTGDSTLGRVVLTEAQHKCVVALAELALRQGRGGPTPLPTSAQAAERLGWPLTTFNRKLDNVCEKLTRNGVRGLHGDAERLATSRRARLVEYCIAVRLVTREDLALLE